MNPKRCLFIVGKASFMIWQQLCVLSMFSISSNEYVRIYFYQLHEWFTRSCRHRRHAYVTKAIALQKEKGVKCHQQQSKLTALMYIFFSSLEWKRKTIRKFCLAWKALCHIWVKTITCEYVNKKKNKLAIASVSKKSGQKAPVMYNAN